MSRTLNLVRRLLASGRKLHRLGADREAARVLGRLSGFRELPADVSEEVQRRLGQLLLKHGRYPRARRHLAAALAARPEEPRYHRLMARAVEKDDRCDPQRAVEHYRRALQLAPNRPRYLSAFGLAAVKHGKAREGLAALRQALELAPDDVAVVEQVIDGLGERQRFQEAERLLRAALFRNPRERRLRRLWGDLRFRRARARQRQLEKVLTDDGPTLLKFVPALAPPTGDRLRTYRPDEPDTIPAPHAARPARPADRKHG